MVSERTHRTRKRKGPPLDANGHPIMQGVDMSCSEDPAAFWGKGWEAAFQEAEDELARGEGRVFMSTEEFLAHLESLGSADADA